MDTKEIGKAFKEKWKGHNTEKIHREFMEAMGNVLFWPLREDNEKDPLHLDSYNLPLFLNSVKRSIDSFNDLYHIVSVTEGWAEEEK